MTPEELFEQLTGRWSGVCRTWFEPGKLADESAVQGTYTRLQAGPFLRHAYTGQMQGKPRQGEETLAFNSVTKRYQISWFDDFHMNYALLFSEGESRDRGFSVSGKYAFDASAPEWGWRTQYVLEDADHLVITAFNVTPGGEEAMAVQTSYVRVR